MATENASNDDDSTDVEMPGLFSHVVRYVGRVIGLTVGVLAIWTVLSVLFSGVPILGLYAEFVVVLMLFVLYPAGLLYLLFEAFKNYSEESIEANQE